MEAVELAVVRLLRLGVTVAAVLMAVGLALQLLGLWPEAARVLGTSGLVILVLTPISRVVAAFWVFLRQRDYPYVLFSFAVLAVLAAGLLAGKAVH